MKPGPELDALVAEKVLGWTDGSGPLCRICLDPSVRHWRRPGAEFMDIICGESGGAFSTDLTSCAAAADEALRAGKIAAWMTCSYPGAMVYGPADEHGYLAPQEWTLGDSPAHALALALVKVVWNA